MATIEATLNANGTGKVLLGGQDISGFSTGISIENDCHKGSAVRIELCAPSVSVKVETDKIFVDIGGKKYRLLPVEE